MCRSRDSGLDSSVPLKEYKMTSELIWNLGWRSFLLFGKSEVRIIHARGVLSNASSPNIQAGDEEVSPLFFNSILFGLQRRGECKMMATE
jgi:hypothetical protein